MAKELVFVTSNGPILGTYNVTKSMGITTSNGRIDISVNAFNDDMTHPTSVTATTSNAYVNWELKNKNKPTHSTGASMSKQVSITRENQLWTPPRVSMTCLRNRTARLPSISSPATVESQLILRKHLSETPFLSQRQRPTRVSTSISTLRTKAKSAQSSGATGASKSIRRNPKHKIPLVEVASASSRSNESGTALWLGPLPGTRTIKREES